MKRLTHSRGYIFPRTLVATAILSIFTLSGVMLLSEPDKPATLMFITPTELLIADGELFKIEVKVRSEIPVNAFTGVLEFNEEMLIVDRIEYNMSIANLWAEEPWFKKGSGTISFAGGSTKAGGFIGEGSVITVYFKGKASGDTKLKLTQTRILQHDGQGTDVTLPTPLDALFTITTPHTTAVIAAPKNIIDIPQTDLNADGKTNITDISIFMLQLTTQNLQSDFNNDGTVNGSDLSIMLGNRT